MELSFGLVEDFLGLRDPSLSIYCTPKLKAFEQGRDVFLLHIPGDVLVPASWSCQVPPGSEVWGRWLRTLYPACGSQVS